MNRTKNDVRSSRALQSSVGQKLVLFLALSNSPALAVQLPRFDEGEERDPRSFSIYATEGAASLQRSVNEHVASGRYLDAIVDLQQLLEEHPAEVLGATRPPAGVSGRRSEGDVHHGAANWARRFLFEAPDDLRQLYTDRYGERARRALEAALVDGDRRALARLARRWPVSSEAERAWLALGDLELEAGNPAEAVTAWRRSLGVALRRTELPELGLEEAELRSLLEESGVDEERAAAHLGRHALAPELGRALAMAADRSAWSTSLSGAEVEVQVPRLEADAWEPFELQSDHPYRALGSRSSQVLYPVRWKDKLLMTTSLEVMAVGAYSGALEWSSGRVPGWDGLRADQVASFREAVDRSQALVSPAVAEGVVVAALQIPLSFEQKMDYGEMSIIRQIPNRRLFAFDADTGAPIWDTVPPAGWDGESGDFRTRMRIVGPPVISGSRVLVPCVRLQGRIEYHVGCFDLFSGELLWSTAIITGQRERNMFGRSVTEYLSPPLAVQGDRVVVQTQLGAMACLDLFTGEMQWETLYEKIGMRRTHSFSAPTRITYWRSAPPRIAGGTVVATPDDSEFLIGLDLESGALLWSIRNRELELLFGASDLDLLVGADDHSIFLSGSHMAALEFPLGIAEFGTNPLETTPQIQWKWPTGSGEVIPSRSPRPVLTGGHVFVPRGSAVSVLRRESGSPVETLPFLSGNLLLADGEVFALRSDSLTGRFDWERLIERARWQLSEEPGNERTALTLAELLEKRGRSSALRGARYEESRRQLAEAREVLFELMGGDEQEAHPRLQARLHSVLRAEAATLRYLGETIAATESLRRARPLAPGREELRDCLLEELDLTRTADPEGWVALTQLLEEECGSLELEVFAGEPSDPEALPPLVPVNLYSAPELPRTSLILPVELWTLLTRLASDVPDEVEFADLHALLARYPDVRLGSEPLATWAAERIGAKLARGEREGYQPFEEQADRLLSQARELGDSVLLSRISSEFPHSSAAARADGARLELALADADPGAVAEIVLGGLGATWSFRDATEEELDALARLAWVLGEAGNLELRAALGARLARELPQLVPALPDGSGRTMVELARSWSELPVTAPQATRASFGDGISSVLGYTLRGRFRPLGEVPPGAGDSPESGVMVFASDNRVQALTTEPEPTPSWQLRLDPREVPDSWSGAFAATRGRAHLATRGRVVGLSRRDGEPLWTWSDPLLQPLSIRSSEGALVVTTEPEDDGDAYVVLALDAASGVELWRRRVSQDAFTEHSVLGDGYLVLLPDFMEREALVLDLFTGSRVATIAMETLSRGTVMGAWIQDGLLVLPNFTKYRDPEQNHIRGIELASGTEAWRISFEEVHQGSQLVRILEYQGETFLAMEPKQRGSRRSGGIYALDATRGLIDPAPLAEFAYQDLWIGVETQQRAHLDAPYVFLMTDRLGDGNQSLRAIHLPYGRRWDTGLRLTDDDLYVPGNMPLPALSSSTVVVAWRELREGPRRRAETIVALLDRSSGELLDTRTLPLAMNGSSLRLTALGSALVLCGSEQMEIWK